MLKQSFKQTPFPCGQINLLIVTAHGPCSEVNVEGT